MTTPVVHEPSGHPDAEIDEDDDNWRPLPKASRTGDDAPILPWLEWAAHEVHDALQQVLDNGTPPRLSSREPQPPEAQGVAVACFKGAELRALAWDDSVGERSVDGGCQRASHEPLPEPSGYVLLLLAEQAAEGGRGLAPLTAAELSSLRVTVSVLGGRRPVKAASAQLTRHEGLLGTGLLFTPEMLRTPDATAAAFQACGARALAVDMLSASCDAPPAPVANDGARAARRGGGGWWWRLGLALLVLGVLYMRYKEDTYSVEWEDFRANYALFGLAEDAPWADVKRAYRTVSVTQHPDKLGSKCDAECQGSTAPPSSSPLSSPSLTSGTSALGRALQRVYADQGEALLGFLNGPAH